jgi:hypothetical protein
MHWYNSGPLHCQILPFSPVSLCQGWYATDRATRNITSPVPTTHWRDRESSAMNLTKAWKTPARTLLNGLILCEIGAKWLLSEQNTHTISLSVRSNSNAKLTGSWCPFAFRFGCMISFWRTFALFLIDNNGHLTILTFWRDDCCRHTYTDSFEIGVCNHALHRLLALFMEFWAGSHVLHSFRWKNDFQTSFMYFMIPMQNQLPT